MNSLALIALLRTACQSSLVFGPGLTAATLLRIGYLMLRLFTAMTELVHRTGDPRLVLAFSELVERFAQQIHQSQLTCALDAEVTGAHALSMDTYTALRDTPPKDATCVADQDDGFDDAVFAGEPQLISGRSCYKNASELLAAWHGLDYFEALQRINDAHLLIGRRTPEGQLCSPRFEHLAKLYAQGGTSRRAITQVARQLNQLEPTDTTFEGTPSTLRAHDANGRTLDESASEVLAKLSPREAKKRIRYEIQTYKELNGKNIPPKLGLFIGRVKNGVHCFSLRTNATDAQLLHSISARSGNPRTKAGRANRQPVQEREGMPEPDPQESEAESDAGLAPTNNDTPGWLRSDQPMPPWADADADADADATRNEEDTEQQIVDPATSDTDSPEDQTAAAEEPDVPMRRLNALMALLAAPFVGGKRKVVVPKFIVYIWLADLQNLAEAHGMTANGVKIPPGELRQLLVKADIIPLVLGGNSQPLDMGRKMRYHQGPIREAILARDRGCIVPGCTVPPDQVETDHYDTPWSEGGETSVWSGAGMCTGDHHKRHAGQIRVEDIDGLPHVILPEHIDPEQKPRRNTYWGARQTGESPPLKEPYQPDPPGLEDPPPAQNLESGQD